jgi:N-formylglutamate deformylase
MALLPFTLTEPAALSPLLVDSPHSGRIYPADFDYACPLPLLRQAEDAFMDEVVAGACEANAALLAAEFPRSLIDPNRAEDDIDPATIVGTWPTPLSPDEMTLSGFGLVRRLCRNGVELYRGNLHVAEIQRRIRLFYRPYHNCLREQVALRLEKFGRCYLINAHSMPDRVDNGIPRPDFILGDRDGSSCDPDFTRFAQKTLQDMGYRVTLNAPYKGREIIKRYGLTGQGAHALQIEINRKLYMDERVIEKNSGFVHLQADMTAFFKIISDYATAECADSLAAE